MWLGKAKTLFKSFLIRKSEEHNIDLPVGPASSGQQVSMATEEKTGWSKLPVSFKGSHRHAVPSTGQNVKLQPSAPAPYSNKSRQLWPAACQHLSVTVLSS